MRKNAILLMLFLVASFVFAQEQKYQLSSHILDIAEGKPVPKVVIRLSKMNHEKEWITIDEKVTDENGRIKDFLKEVEGVNHQGIYKLTYFTQPYFEQIGVKSFYPFIDVVFALTDDNHYHVPITLSPFGYSTYRGN